MGSASVARIPEPDKKEIFRQMIHDELDKWADQIVDEVFDLKFKGASTYLYLGCLISSL